MSVIKLTILRNYKVDFLHQLFNNTLLQEHYWIGNETIFFRSEFWYSEPKSAHIIDLSRHSSSVFLQNYFRSEKVSFNGFYLRRIFEANLRFFSLSSNPDGKNAKRVANISRSRFFFWKFIFLEKLLWEIFASRVQSTAPYLHMIIEYKNNWFSSLLCRPDGAKEA